MLESSVRSMSERAAAAERMFTADEKAAAATRQAQLARLAEQAESKPGRDLEADINKAVEALMARADDLRTDRRGQAPLRSGA